MSKTSARKVNHHVTITNQHSIVNMVNVHYDKKQQQQLLQYFSIKCSYFPHLCFLFPFPFFSFKYNTMSNTCL